MDNPEKLARYGTQDEDKSKQKHNTICFGHHYTHTNTNNVIQTWALLRTTTTFYICTICPRLFTKKKNEKTIRVNGKYKSLNLWDCELFL